MRSRKSLEKCFKSKSLVVIFFRCSTRFLVEASLTHFSTLDMSVIRGSMGGSCKPLLVPPQTFNCFQWLKTSWSSLFILREAACGSKKRLRFCVILKPISQKPSDEKTWILSELEKKDNPFLVIPWRCLQRY